MPAQVLRSALEERVMSMFAEPVPAGEPFYHQMIRRPMDLGTISGRLSRGHYKTLGKGRPAPPAHRSLAAICSRSNDAMSLQ